MTQFPVSTSNEASIFAALIRKNISVKMHDSRATGEMLGHKTMAMTGWYVEKATAPFRACRGEVAPQQDEAGQERMM